MTYRLVVVIAAGALLVAGCSTADDPDDDSPTPVPEGETTALDDTMLLVATEMPAWNNAGTWVATDDAGFLRVCPLTDPESLGATDTQGVTYQYVVELDEGDAADSEAEPMLGGNILASFSDEATAASAVEAWRAELAACSEDGELTQLDGGATWTGSDLDEATELAWFDFTGVAAKGASTTIVGFSLQGQDANVESDPLAAPIQTSIDRLP